MERWLGGVGRELFLPHLPFSLQLYSFLFSCFPINTLSCKKTKKPKKTMDVLCKRSFGSHQNVKFVHSPLSSKSGLKKRRQPRGVPRGIIFLLAAGETYICETGSSQSMKAKQKNRKRDWKCHFHQHKLDLLTEGVFHHCSNYTSFM